MTGKDKYKPEQVMTYTSNVLQSIGLKETLNANFFTARYDFENRKSGKVLSGIPAHKLDGSMKCDQKTILLLYCRLRERCRGRGLGQSWSGTSSQRAVGAPEHRSFNQICSLQATSLPNPDAWPRAQHEEEPSSRGQTTAGLPNYPTPCNASPLSQARPRHASQCLNKL